MIAVVADLEIEVEDDSVNFDDSQAPHVQWQATARVPLTQDEIDRLDPNLRPRALVQWGGVTLDLVLTEAAVQRPGNRLTLAAESDERILMDYGTLATEVTSGEEAFGAISRLIKGILPNAHFLDTGVRGYGFVDPEEPIVIKPGEDVLNIVWDIADRAGDRWVYNDGLEWHLTSRPELASTPKLTITVGEDGLITDSNSSRSRDEWANSVVVVYTWQDEVQNAEGRTDRVDREVQGWASVMTGPYDVSAVGRRIKRVERKGPVSQVTANAAAQSLLKRYVTKGRSLDLGAVVDEGLRPGDTIGVRLPLGPLERHLVQAITYHRPTGVAEIKTRTPLDTFSSIQNGA